MLSFLLILRKIGKKLVKLVKKRFKALLIIFILSTAYLIGVPLYINNYSRYKIIDAENVPDQNYYVAVLGTGVEDDNTPTPALQDRLDTAIEIYQSGRAEEIIITGNEALAETSVMKEYLIEQSIDETSIIEDYSARRTYENCEMISEKSHTDEVILVSQEYHLPRAIYLCEHLGIKSMGVSASKQDYPQETYWNIREFFAKHKAFLDIIFAPGSKS
ncbi:hypothetical protein GF357_01825 [Candidatus Dojkabacteria bacterium]|nr:hypothetical protein [Candidatus Dojkabacteria bacterium]